MINKTKGKSDLKTESKKRKSGTFRKICDTVRVIIIIVSAIIITGYSVTSGISGYLRPAQLKSVHIPDWIDVQIIDMGGPPRSGRNLKEFRNVVIHYVGNPGSTAQQNRDFFDSDQSRVSAHFTVGLDGEIIQCLPLNEMSAASNNRNPDTISIEICHPDSSGKFTDETYNSVIKLTSWLCSIGHLDADDVIRHYDITGKECPRYYVRHEDAWLQMKKDIAAELEK